MSRRREFRGVKVLAADINVAPNYTLDTVETIVTHPEVRIRGLLLTLKLLDWKLADELAGISRSHSQLGLRPCESAAIAPQPAGSVRGGEAKITAHQSPFCFNVPL